MEAADASVRVLAQEAGSGKGCITVAFPGRGGRAKAGDDW